MYTGRGFGFGDTAILAIFGVYLHIDKSFPKGCEDFFSFFFHYTFGFVLDINQIKYGKTRKLRL